MMKEVGFKLREPIIWVKGPPDIAISTSSAMGSDSNPYMRPCHELILLGSKGRYHHDGGTGCRGEEAVPYPEYTKDVWFISPGGSSWHPATFPEEIPYRLITLFVHRSNTQDLPKPIVLDPFAGSFTVAVMAERMGCDWICCDANLEFVKRGRERILEARPQLELF